jgi:uncharacterized protein YqeY
MQIPLLSSRVLLQSVAMASTYETLRADIITAMKARDQARTTVLRTMDAAIQRASMDQNKPIDEALAVATIRKAVKNLSDAKAEFERGGRNDLAAANGAEIEVLQTYLPKGIDGAKLEALIDETIKATGATTKKEMGKVMGALKQHPDAGLIDFGSVSKLLQSRLQ